MLNKMAFCVGPMMMVLSSITLLLFACACRAQELHIKHAPPYVSLQSQASPIPSSQLHHVLAAPLGLSGQGWATLQSKSVLKRPKANILITVATHQDKSLPMDSLARFPLDWDVPFVDIEQLMNNVQRTFLDKDPLMLDLTSDTEFFDMKTSSPFFESLPSTLAMMRERFLDADSILNRVHSPVVVTALNSSLASDGGLLAELQIMEDVVSKLKQHRDHLSSKTPDVLAFTLRGLQAVGEQYGPNSPQALEAEDILNKHIDQLSADLRKLYKDNVMVEVLVIPTLGEVKVRKARSLMAVVANTNYSSLNLEIEYYDSFPVTFNICLWLIVVLSLAVMFVAYGIWNMNPNLESILYRVPQDELKKNN